MSDSASSNASPDPAQRPSPPPLFSERTALILLLAAAVGTTAGVLTYFAQGNSPAAMLAGLAAGGVAIGFFHRFLG
jgi:hypothetical protein